MPPPDLARLLLAKSDQDIYVLEKLVLDDAAPVEVFGFHAQQATEKLLKASLSKCGIAYGRIHRLGDLVDLGTDHQMNFPEDVEALVDLTPYAVEYRYDSAPDDGRDDLDKTSVLEKVRSFRAWVVSRIEVT